MASYDLRAPNVQEAMASRPQIAIDRERVHVWSITLAATEADLAQCRDLLSEAEILRASRFHRRADRDQYTLAHGLLRQILSHYCATPPAELQFMTGPGGKPLLRPTGGPSIAFNLSHTSGRMLLAIAHGCEVGVDVEAVDRALDPVRLARRYFFGSEFEDIRDAPESERVTRFFQYWVAKEATLKAAGIGLGLPLDALRVRFTPDRSEARIESLEPQRLAVDWTVQMLSCERGWVAALAGLAPQSS